MTQVDKLVEILKDYKPHTTTELKKRVGHRFGASLLTLRKKQGLNIISTKLNKTDWEFRWDGFTDSYTPNRQHCPGCNCEGR
jgi:hypothetical protein